jgi:hypothetical protein
MKQERQAAAEALIMAAEDREPLLHAHLGMMLAPPGVRPISKSSPSKKSKGQRKLKRDG